MDAFKILGLTNQATVVEIKARWRELCQVHHPDRETGDAHRFHEITQAYRLATQEAEARPCVECLGAGFVTRTRGFETVRLACPRCQIKL